MDADAARSRELAAALVRVAGGDRAALRLVYQDTSAKLFGVCLRILKDRSESEDVLQDVYVTVWRKAASFDPGRASAITWMVAIARNRSIDRLRSRAAGGRLEPIEAADVVSDPAPAALERVELAQEQQRLARCLEELDARHATAIRAAFLDGATYEQLAARTARHDEELDSARPVETESLSRTMNDDDTIDPADRGRLVAAEYVLGVLGAEERREVERRLMHEPALAAEVAFWEERLGALADAVAPVAPPQHTWSRIEAAVASPQAARPASLWENLAFWRGFGVASATLAAASIAALVYIGLIPATRAPLMATLAGSSGQPNVVAAVTGNDLLVVPAALLTNDPRAVELWLILPNQRPHSLGLIHPGQAMRLTIPPDLAGRLTPDAALAISLEPPGGSPTGQPTGPVIASGRLTGL
ncbi:MAG: sigma-70 family RNA polymerase sigma factor [Xanthobacteraceae bacterium]